MSHLGTHLTEGGALSALLGWLAKWGWKSVQRDRRILHDIKDELVLQRTNCLTTIQEQGKEQTELLKGISKELAEQTGFLRGYLEGRHS